MIKNVLSVDLESFVHRDFEIKRRKYPDDGYTVKTITKILELLNKYDTRATFFVVGEIFDLYPQLIREIKARGHEIGYHSHRHTILKNDQALINELKLSKKFLNEYKPKGFRAPRMLLKKSMLAILKKNGFTYDSSTYGSYQKKTVDGILEVPVSFLSYFGKQIPVEFPQNFNKLMLLKGIPIGSGLQLSVFQKNTQFFINLLNFRKEPAIIFIHPWQIEKYSNDTIPLTWKSWPRFLYKRSIYNTLEYLLKTNKFTTFEDLINT